MPDVDLYDKMMTVDEVAEVFSVRPYTVREWLKGGKLHGVKVDHSWRIPTKSFETFAREVYGLKEEK